MTTITKLLNGKYKVVLPDGRDYVVGTLQLARTVANGYVTSEGVSYMQEVAPASPSVVKWDPEKDGDKHG